MQDAVERSSQQLGEHVGTVRDRFARLQTREHELAEREGKIEKIRSEMDAATAEPVRYAAFIPNWVFWMCAVLLAAVEFFANFPVFRLLLPLDPELEQAAASAARNVDDRSWGAGVELFGRNLVWNVEAGLVALAAVIVLVVLGKQVGKSLRPIVALRAADHPLAARTVRAHQRQHLVSAGISLFGLVCVLGFLTASRCQIAQTAASRVVQDSLALVEAQGDFVRRSQREHGCERPPAFVETAAATRAGAIRTGLVNLPVPRGPERIMLERQSSRVCPPRPPVRFRVMSSPRWHGSSCDARHGMARPAP